MLCGLAVANGQLKRIERVAAELNRFIDGMDEHKMVELGKALEDVVPIVARLDVARLAGEDIAELRGLNWRHDEQVVAVLADALESIDDVICVNAIDFVGNDNALKDLRVRERLRALEVR